MITETGVVVAVDGDGVWVETLKKSVCGRCAAKSVCGSKLLAENQAKNITHIKAYFSQTITPSNWTIGDQAQIGIQESVLLQLAFWAYIFPLVSMIGSILLANQLFQSESIVLIFGLLGLLFGGLCAKFFINFKKQRQTFQPIVLSKKLSKNQELNLNQF